MEKEFPTVAFAAQLEKAENPVLKNQDTERMVQFLKSR
jgi:hypothetical protein